LIPTGHWNVSELDSAPTLLSNYTNLDQPVWSGQWVDALKNHVALLEPKPDYFIFNSGLWPEHNLTAETFTAIKDTLDKAGIIGIYKTSTAWKGSRVKDIHSSHEPAGCEIIGNCFNLSWTGEVNVAEYADGTHYGSRVNNRMNFHLFELLSDISKGKIPKLNFTASTFGVTWKPDSALLIRDLGRSQNINSTQ
jgi:hypothetical protein